MKNKYIILAALAIGFASCEPEFDNPVSQDYSAGNANFSKYVAIGNSLTAGFMDGNVSRGSQINSYPNLLSQQFALVGGGVFEQPSYVNDLNNTGGFLLGGNPIPGFGSRLVLDASQGRPEPLALPVTMELSNLQAKAYNNMGVPGAKSFHLLAPGYGNIANLPNANPYFIRHATTPNATVFADALTKAPTFFTNWIGNNDILSYATSGGVGVDQNAAGNNNPSTYGGNDITSAALFTGVYNFLINGGTNPLTGQTGQAGLTTNGAKGVVCTIPSVTSIPYFTTVPYNALPAAATASNAQVNGLYQFLAAVTGGRISPLSTVAGTRNPVLINDENLSDLSATIAGAASTQPSLAPFASTLGALYGKARQATVSDLLVLTASGIIGQPNTTSPVPSPFNINGVTLPLADQWVLIPSELTAISNATTAYNAAINAIANAKNTAAGTTVIAVADMNMILGQLTAGLRADNGTVYTANYFSGGASEFKVLFSLDGVHPNARGYAVIANEIIKVINAKFNANLPLKNPSTYPGINILGTN